MMPADLSTRARSVVPAPLRPVAKRAYHRALPPAARRGRLAAQFRAEAHACRRAGSPLYGELLEHVADDVARGGPCWDVVSCRPPSAAGAHDGIPMRFMGAVHRLALAGRAPALAAHYPSCGGRPSAGVWAAFRFTVAENAGDLAGLLEQPVQTNEVGRSAALVGGFLLVARRTGLPLRLLEVGASAGLNLRWPEYRFVGPAGAWGDPSSPVQLHRAIVEGRPPFDVEVAIAAREGCDPAPLDVSRAEHRLALLSFLWPDQPRRFALLEGALEVAARVPVELQRAGAVEWIEDRLAAPAEGQATVVFHSIVMPYLDERARRRFAAVVRDAGGRATDRAPLAWLRMEWGAGGAETRLTTWPDGREQLVATSDNLGREVRWLAS